MSNPAVVLLASLNEIIGFPYRFEIEDNIGEAIHIHYKDIRLDMTIAEFNELANTLRDIFVELVDNKEFHIENFDAGNLLWLAEPMIHLKHIVEEEIFLEDILVDTYDEEGRIKYLPLPNSRVLKALRGDTSENDKRKQINYFNVNECDRQSNQERLQYDLDQIRTYGYPVNDELILLREDNTIIDGQHRASCLYYLYGNIKVPVRKISFSEKENAKMIVQQSSEDYYKGQNEMIQQKYFDLEQRYHNLDVVLNERDAIIHHYQEEERRRERDVRILDQTINEKDAIIKKYQDQIKELENELEKIQNSRSWRITKPLRKITGNDN